MGQLLQQAAPCRRQGAGVQARLKSRKERKGPSDLGAALIFYLLPSSAVLEIW
jgi:hypothetical protein